VSASAALQARTEKKRTKSSTSGASPTGSLTYYSNMEPPRTPREQSRLGVGSGSVSGASHRDATSPRPTDPLTAATHLCIPNAQKNKARSVRSTVSGRSRRSKWGDDDAEPLGDVKRREFNEFHANNGVRTVLGAVGDVKNGVFLGSGTTVPSAQYSADLSPHASQAGPQAHLHLADFRYAPWPHLTQGDIFCCSMLTCLQQTLGVGGYSGLQILGNVPITVGSRTGIHTVMLSEEPHFDVILGRAWIEKMNIK
jgi:hypothetical protein